MSSKHTPGPWGYSEGYSGSFAIKAPSRRGASVANVLPHIEIPDDEKEANARLIAAAPDLLEALEELLAHAAFVGIAPHYDQMARAAIAKARGLP